MKMGAGMGMGMGMTDFGEWPQLPATMENVRWIRDNKRARVLFWDNLPKHNGLWQSVFCDIQTANVLVTVRDALNEQHQKDFDQKVEEGSGKFVQLVDFCWGQVKAKGEG